MECDAAALLYAASTNCRITPKKAGVTIQAAASAFAPVVQQGQLSAFQVSFGNSLPFAFKALVQNVGVFELSDPNVAVPFKLNVTGELCSLKPFALRAFCVSLQISTSVRMAQTTVTST